MPTISVFYGIVIQMFWDDHNPPHFHARYGGAHALVRIADGKIISGELPPSAAGMVEKWALLRRKELEHNWLKVSTHDELERIAGPDGQG